MRHAAVQLVAPHIDLVDEHGQPALRPAFDLVGLQHHRRQRIETASVGPRIGLQLGKGRVPHPALRLVDHPLEGEVIVRRAHQPEVGHRIADLGTLEEARAADHPVRDAEQDEPLLERPHLPGRAHQHGALVMPPAAAHPGLDIVRNQAALRLAIPETAHLHLRRIDVAGRRAVITDEQRLAEASLVVRDHRGSGCKYMFCRAIIALKPDHLGARKVVFEAQDIVHFRAAPTIDRLVVIAHAADVLRTLREQAQPEILRDVRVLILVDQDVAELRMKIPKQIRVLLEDRDVVDQQVAEVAGVQHLQPRLVDFVTLDALAVAKQLRLVTRHPVGRQRAVLPAIDQAGEVARGPALGVEVLGLDDLLAQAHLVVGVEDREGRLEADQFGMPPQDLRRDRVEGAEPAQALARLAEQGERPLAHLPRRLVGEGHRQRLRRVSQPRRHDMRQPSRQHPRLAGACARQHQQRAFGVQHGFALFGVQPLQIGRALRHRLGRTRRRHLADRETIRIGTHRERIAGTGALVSPDCTCEPIRCSGVGRHARHPAVPPP